MKRARVIILFVTFLVSFYTVSAQQSKRNNIWYFGYNAGLDFNGGSPKEINDSKMRQWEGCSSISSPEGKLLLYTNGIKIWNGHHQVVPGAVALNGNNTSTQSAIIVPKPGNENLFYVFITFQTLHCVLIDISLNNGEGGIVSNEVLLESSTEKLASVRHCNTKDYWIVAHEKSNNVFHSFLLNSEGLKASSIKSKTGSIYDAAGLGYLKFSSDGSKLGAALFGKSAFDLLDFDRSSGVISKPITISGDFHLAYGLEFSPNGKFLYLTETLAAATQIFQFDVSSNNSKQIKDSQSVIGTTSGTFFGALQLGADNRIYVAKNQSASLGIIDSPNKKGTDCHYDNQGILLSHGKSRIGLPNLITGEEQEQHVTILEDKDCNDVTLTAQFSYQSADLVYQWYMNETPISEAKESFFKPVVSGNYHVVLTGKCVNGEVLSKNVEVNILDAKPTFLLGECGTAKLLANTSAEITWSGNGIQESEKELREILVNGNGKQVFTLKVQDPLAESCFVEKELEVEFKDCIQVFAPDIFTPNQDGVNDIFKILIVGGKAVQLDIYNRWGNVIYSNKAAAEWDGRINGACQQQEYYVYVLRYVSDSGTELQKKGMVLLKI